MEKVKSGLGWLVFLGALLWFGFAVWQAEQAPADSNTLETPGPTATATALEPTAAPSPFPTPTAPPLSYTFSEEDREDLANLCVVEARGMGEAREELCLDMISTVIARLAVPGLNGKLPLHAATIQSVLTQGPEQDSPWQFPAYVTFDYCPDTLMDYLCPYNHDRTWAFATVDAYSAGARGRCSGYLFYDSLPGGPADCRVDWMSTGQYVEFHAGWD